MSLTRKVKRRQDRRLTSLDHGVQLQTGQKSVSKGKRIKNRTRGLKRAIAMARMLIGLFIRATGAHTAPLTAEGTKLDPYKRSIALRGTFISPANAENPYVDV